MKTGMKKIVVFFLTIALLIGVICIDKSFEVRAESVTVTLYAVPQKPNKGDAVTVVISVNGTPNSEYKSCPECRSEEALESFIRELKSVVRIAENFGVMFAIEPVAKHIVWNADRARIVLDEVASPNLGIIFDPVNLLDESNYQNRDEIFAHTIEVLGDDIIMLHLKDFVPGEGGLKSVGCGLGEMDYTRILKFIKEKKPYIHATLENTTPADHASCRDRILGIYERS